MKVALLATILKTDYHQLRHDKSYMQLVKRQHTKDQVSPFIAVVVEIGCIINRVAYLK